MAGGSSNDINDTINYCYDQIWEITIVLKLNYHLVPKPVPKFMSSHDLVPIRNKLPMVDDTKPYASVHEPFATKCKVFVHNTVYGFVASNVVCYLHKVSYGSSDDLSGHDSTSALMQHQKFQKAK